MISYLFNFNATHPRVELSVYIYTYTIFWFFCSVFLISSWSQMFNFSGSLLTAQHWLLELRCTRGDGLPTQPPLICNRIIKQYFSFA